MSYFVDFLQVKMFSLSMVDVWLYSEKESNAVQTNKNTT